MKIVKDKVSGQIHLETDVISINMKLLSSLEKYLTTLEKCSNCVSYNKEMPFWD